MKTRISLLIALCVFSLFITPLAAFAETYYVSTKGNDHSDGSINAPFRTLQRAADRVHAGDTVLVSDGTYGGFSIRNKSGAPGSWIVFKPLPGNRVIIDPFTNNYAAGNGRSIDIIGGSYIEINGFEMTDSNPIYESSLFRDYRKGTNREAIKIDSFHGTAASFIKIANNHLYHLPFHGIYSSYNSSHCEILDNVIESVGRSRRGYGMYIGGSYHTIRGNTVHDAYGSGIQVYTEDGPKLDFNVIEKNVIYNNGHSDYGVGYVDDGFPPKGKKVGCGIVLTVGKRSTSTGNVITQNTVYHNLTNGIDINRSHNATITKNVAHDNGHQGIYVGDDLNAVVEDNKSYSSRNEDGSSGNAYIGKRNSRGRNSFFENPA